MNSRPPYLRKTANGWLAQSPAKLNLYLEVFGRRNDGFHELQTLITPIGLFDTLEVWPAAARDDSIRLSVTGGGQAAAIPTDERNLVVRALALLKRRLGAIGGVEAKLHKRVPVEAGLGGGSSNAAAALELGQRAWGQQLPDDELSDLAAELGSDVPVLLRPGSAICRGRGEQVERVADLPRGISCVLVQPPIGLSAAGVYRELTPQDYKQTPTPAGRLPGLLAALRAGRLVEAGRLLLNHLQAPAARVARDKGGDWINRLARLFDGLPVAAHQMSGSGSVYFGLCENGRLARRVAGWLRQQRVGRVAVAATC